MGGFSLLFIFKRRLDELKGVSYVFLTALALFITLLYVELARDDPEKHESVSELSEMKVDFKLLTSISILLFAISFQFIVFPAYSELERRSNSRFELATFWSLLIYSICLIATGVAACFLFGKNLKSDVLENIGGHRGGLSVFIRVIYVFILLFHLPYVFFALKEYVLVMYDEVLSRTLTNHLEDKI